MKTAQTKNAHCKGTGDPKLVPFKPKHPGGCIFDYRAQTLHQNVMKAVISAGQHKLEQKWMFPSKERAVKYPIEISY